MSRTTGDKVSRHRVLYGTDEPPLTARVLRTGPFSVLLDQGNLRYIRLGEREILRAVSFVVRDTGWGTYTPAIEDLAVSQTDGLCSVSYGATCRGPEGVFRYTADIRIDAQGQIRFAVEGTADADFSTNRTGFVVLHPIEGVAGAPVEVVHTDGRAEHTRFPRLIEPWQPICDIRALIHEPAPGLRVVCRMEGDAFEMEDHRNWGDASYKTYIRPLSRGFPYVIPGGERVEQKVEVSISGALESSGGAPRTTTSIHLRVGEVSGSMPEMGVALDASDAEQALGMIGVVKELGPQRILARFEAHRRHGAAQPASIEALRQASGVPVALEVVIPGRDPAKELRSVASDIAGGGLNVAEIVISPARDLKSRPSGVPSGEASLDDILTVARSVFPDVAIGGGSLAYFTELNRNPPLAGSIDFVTHSFAANIHAADDRSVMETLETIPHMARTLRALVPDKPHHIGFAAIGMREAPYGAGPATNPQAVRMAAARDDPRHQGLFGAAWALGLASAASREGIARMTLGALAGPFSLAAASGRNEIPVQLSPLGFVVQGLAAVAGYPRREVAVSDPGRVRALACNGVNGLELWIANLTADQLEVELEAIRPTTVCVLDADQVGSLAGGLRDFRSRRAAREGNPVLLDAYAVARIRGDGA